MDGENDRPANSRRLELLTVMSLWPGLLASLIGAAGTFVPLEAARVPAMALMVAGLVLLTLAVAASYPLASMRAIGTQGGQQYERLKHRRQLKMWSLLLNGLAVGGVLVFLLSLLARGGMLQARLDPDILDRGAIILIAAMGLAQGLAHHHVLRFENPRDTTGTRLVLSLLGMCLAMLGAALATLALVRDEALLDVLGISGTAVPMLLVGGHTFCAYALFVSRKLPTFSILYNEERDTYGKASTQRSRQVLLPALVAFGLLILVFFVFVVFGVGVVDVITNVAQSPVLLGAVAFFMVTLLVSFGAALSLARNEEQRTPLWRTPRNPRERLQATILLTTLGVALLLWIVGGWLWAADGALGMPAQWWVHFFCIGMLVALGPYGFYMAREARRIRGLEERFPDFLRDIASSHKGGLTLAESIRVAARGEYGPLTPEIHKMAEQLSWNVAFPEALARFGDRVQTPLVERATSLILEANRSGGSTTDVLLAAARDAREIKNLENQRRLSMSLYTIVIYITFFVFLAVAAVLYAQFVPAILESSEAASQSSIPTSGLGGIGGENLRLEDFQLFYFMAAVMQGLGDGIVAGMMGSGRAVLGLRHSFVMVLISYVTFTLFLV